MAPNQSNSNHGDPSMKAVRLNEFGDIDVLKIEELPEPNLRPHHVMIKVDSAGVNYADILRRGGLRHLRHRAVALEPSPVQDTQHPDLPPPGLRYRRKLPGLLFRNNRERPRLHQWGTRPGDQLRRANLKPVQGIRVEERLKRVIPPSPSP